MNRMEILLLDRRNGVICNEYVDAESVLLFLNRTGHINRFQLFARKGAKGIYMDRIDLATFAQTLHDFNSQNP